MIPNHDNISQSTIQLTSTTCLPRSLRGRCTTEFQTLTTVSWTIVRDGYIIYFCGIAVAWKSKSMKSVVLSTTEAEYVAVSEVVKEIKFLYQMLRSMEIKVPLPIMVQMDNVVAIWLVNNSSVSERTKHVDLRADFVREMIKDQVIEIYFVKSAENDSDIMTKN